MRGICLLSGLVLLGVTITIRADNPPSPQHIEKLVKQLGDSQFSAREKAQHDLEAIGPPALDFLHRPSKVTTEKSADEPES